MTVRVERDKDRPNRIRVDAPFHYNDLIKSIPGSNWSNPHRCWTIPLAWTACLASRAVFGAELEIGPDLQAWAIEERVRRVVPAMSMRDALDALGDEDLYPHQRAGVQYLATVERALLTDEPGTGKTAQVIRTLKALHERGDDPFPALVVCPNTVKRTWKREFEQWWPDVDVVVVDGSADKRRKQIDSGAEVTVVNWEALRVHSRLAPYGSLALKRCEACGGSGAVREAQCQVHDKELNRIDYATVVSDEAHKMKDPKSQMSMALRGATGDARFRFALTGTPIANHAGELWSLLNWLDPQEWPSRTKWMERMLALSYNVWGGIEITGVKPEADAEFRAGVDPRMRRMTKEIVLPSLPPKVFERRDVPMHAKQERAYEQMLEEMAAALASGVLLATNSLTKVTRLVQLASSFGDVEKLPDGEERLTLLEPSNKVDAFMDDLDDFEGQSVAVFAESRQLVELLSAAMRRKSIRHGLITGAQDGDTRQRTIEDFQHGDYRFVLCTIKAGGVGITLNKASIAVFIQRSWSSVDMSQAHDRVHRIGSDQHESILIVDYVTPDSIEEAQLWALKHKRDLLQEIVRDKDLLRKVLEGGFRA